MARKPNTPYKLPTKSRIRNIILTILVILLLAAGVGYGLYKAFGTEILPIQQESVVNAPQIVPQPAKPKSETESLFTVEKAKETLVAYYNGLAASDSDMLRSIGADATAAAVDNGWIEAMGYAVDTSKTSAPVATEMPADIGKWAGNNIYNIYDFYDPNAIQAAIRNNITGLTDVKGWIYFDTALGRWAIVDPTIPTATNAAEIPKLEKFSQDRLIDIRMSSVGALSNSWWSYAQLNYEISNSNTTTPVTITQREFDEGMTVLVSPKLLEGLQPATEKKVEGTNANNTDNADANAAANNATDAGNSANANHLEAVETVPSKVSGICIVYRGTIDNFDFRKMSSAPLSISGDVNILSISTEAENLTPIYTVGDVASEDVRALLSQEEIDRYNASGELPPDTPKVITVNSNGSNAAASPENGSAASENSGNTSGEE